MSDIEQALAEALVAYRVDGKYQLWEYADHAEEFFGSPQELARGMAVTEPMQSLARQAAIGAAVLYEHKTCTPRECRMYSEYGFSWEGYRPMNIVPCRVAAIADALETPTSERSEPSLRKDER